MRPDRPSDQQSPDSHPLGTEAGVEDSRTPSPLDTDLDWHDVSLIEQCLARTPLERLLHAQAFARNAVTLRHAKRIRS